MHFLLTNDDGIDAPGLWAAAHTLSSMGSVLIVAPEANCSGYGSSHPPTSSMTCRRYAGKGRSLSNVVAYALSATPAACAHVGLNGVFTSQPIDLVVSGVNAGANLGRDVLYSGTVGAALTAQLLGYPAIAVSLDLDSMDEAHWGSCDWAICHAIDMWRRRVDPSPVVFNVNVPNIPPSELRGAQLTAFGLSSFLGKYEFRLAGSGQATVTARRRDVWYDRTTAGSDSLTDDGAVRRGYVSITPLRPFPDLLCVAPWVEADQEFVPAAAVEKTKF